MQSIQGNSLDRNEAPLRTREPIVLVSLVFLVALATVGRAQEFPRFQTRSANQLFEPILTEDVEGTWKSNPQEAKADAIDSARRVVTEFLRAQNPPIDWVPSEEFVKKQLIKSASEKPLTKDFGPDVGLLYQTKIRIVVTNQALTEMVQQSRLHRMQERQVDLFKVFACLVPLLVILSVYLRLEEWNKGKVSLGWLRLAAASCVGAAGSLGFWLWH